MTERAMVAVCDILGFSNTVKNTTQKRLETQKSFIMKLAYNVM